MKTDDGRYKTEMDPIPQHRELVMRPPAALLEFFSRRLSSASNLLFGAYTDELGVKIAPQSHRV